MLVVTVDGELNNIVDDNIIDDDASDIIIYICIYVFMHL